QSCRLPVRVRLPTPQQPPQPRLEREQAAAQLLPVELACSEAVPQRADYTTDCGTMIVPSSNTSPCVFTRPRSPGASIGPELTMRAARGSAGQPRVVWSNPAGKPLDAREPGMSDRIVAIATLLDSAPHGESSGLSRGCDERREPLPADRPEALELLQRAARRR